MKSLKLTAILCLIAGTMQAQEVYQEGYSDAIITPQFFITVIAGVILALGFQFILTALSVAAGISAIGDVKKNYVQNKTSSDSKTTFSEEDQSDEDNTGSPGSAITTGFGIWSTLTVMISLFGATAFAMNLSLINNSLIAITLALVIWATFFILLFYLETKVVNTVIGGLINTATSGLRSSASGIKNLFSPSETSKMESMADHTIEKVRKEFQNSFDPNILNEAIDKFYSGIGENIPDYEKVKNDIQQIVDDSVEKSNNESNSGKESGNSTAKWMAIQSILNKAINEAGDDNSDEGKSKTEQLTKLKNDLEKAYQKGDTGRDKAAKIMSKLTPAEEEQVGDYLKNIEEFVSSNGSNSLTDSELENNIKKIIENPKVEGSKIAQKFNELDRNKIIKILTDKTSLSRMEVEQYADKIEKTLRKLQLELRGISPESIVDDVKEKVEDTLKNITSRSGSGSSFSQLSRIVKEKLDNPNEQLDTIKGRLSNLNKEEVIGIVTNNTKIDRKDIDKIVASIEDAKNDVLKNIQQIEDKARSNIKIIERKAVIQAEHARHTAASAAWWLVVSAVFSACAAIGGSLLTVF